MTDETPLSRAQKELEAENKLKAAGLAIEKTILEEVVDPDIAKLFADFPPNGWNTELPILMQIARNTGVLRLQVLTAMQVQKVKKLPPPIIHN